MTDTLPEIHTRLFIAGDERTMLGGYIRHQFEHLISMFQRHPKRVEAS